MPPQGQGIAERHDGKTHQRGDENGGRRGKIDEAVHMPGNHILLEQEFQAVGKRLQQSPGPHTVRTQTVLDIRADFPLGQYEIGNRAQHPGENHDDFNGTFYGEFHKRFYVSGCFDLDEWSAPVTDVVVHSLKGRDGVRKVGHNRFDPVVCGIDPHLPVDIPQDFPVRPRVANGGQAPPYTLYPSVDVRKRTVLLDKRRAGQDHVGHRRPAAGLDVLNDQKVEGPEGRLFLVGQRLQRIAAQQVETPYPPFRHAAPDFGGFSDR